MDLFNKKKLKEKEIIIEEKRQKIAKLIESNEHLIRIGEDLQKENRKLIEIIEKAIKYIENNDAIFIDKDTNLLANEVKLLKILKGE